MNNRQAFTIGAICGVAIAIVVVLAWPLRYATHPWPGYEIAAAQDHVAREYNSSPLALRDVLITLTVLGLAAGALPYRRPTGLLVTWLGVWLGLFLSAFAWPETRGSNLAPLGLIVYPIQTLPFLVVAYASAAGRRLVHHAG